MDRVKQTSLIRVSILGMSDKMENMLRFFFQGPCNNFCELVDGDVAEMSIIDLDGLQGRQHLEQHRANYPDKPVILLSFHDEEFEGATLLRKPLKPELLVTALETLYAQSLPPIDVTNKFNSTEESEKTATKSANRHSQPVASFPDSVQVYSSTVADNKVELKPLELPPSAQVSVKKAPSRVKRFKAAMSLNEQELRSYIGSAPDIDLNNPAQLASAFYKTEGYFQGHLSQAVNLAKKYAKAVEMSIPQGTIVVLPDAKTVLLTIAESRLRAFCAIPVYDTVLTKEFMDENKLEQFKGQADVMELEPLLWKAAIWASRGRLPQDTSLTATVNFKRWPNLTRLQRFPHALRIAALWSEQPCSLLDTARILNIPQRYVFVFYSACNALGLTSVMQQPAVIKDEVEPIKQNKRRNLFGRILSHLRSNH